VAVIFLNNKLTAKSGEILIGWIIIEQSSELMIAQLSEFRVRITDDFKKKPDCEWFF